MKRDGDEVKLNEEEASGGSKENVVRYVLAASLVLAVIAMTAIWMTGAATR
jgi:uncharacterized protein YPO0396